MPHTVLWSAGMELKAKEGKGEGFRVKQRQQEHSRSYAGKSDLSLKSVTFMSQNLPSSCSIMLSYFDNPPNCFLNITIQDRIYIERNFSEILDP